MSKKSAVLDAKFKLAVKMLRKAPMLTVEKAMLVANFLMKDIKHKSTKRIVLRQIPGSKRAMVAPALSPSIIDEACASQMSNLSTLTTGGNDEAIAGFIQSPMRKQQIMPASAWQQKRVGDLWLKRHKVTAHKEAMQLYTHEREIPVRVQMPSR